jgi:putative transposase
LALAPSRSDTGQDAEILAKRDAVYAAARERRPDRWTGNTRDWTPIESVVLNPALAEHAA